MWCNLYHHGGSHSRSARQPEPRQTTTTNHDNHDTTTNHDIAIFAILATYIALNNRHF